MTISGLLGRFPLWTLVKASSLTTDAAGESVFSDRVEFLIVEISGIKKSLPVFTGPDAADDFLDAKGIDDAEIIPIPDPEFFSAMLGSLGGDAQFVAVDLDEEGSTLTVWPISDVMLEMMKPRK